MAKAADAIARFVERGRAAFDEIGYLPISRTGAMLFCQVISRRYERASTVLTSNKGFEEWGKIFGDEVMAGARIDRLVHHCHIVNIRGNSYRLRHHADVHRAQGSPRHPPAGAPQRASRSRTAEASASRRLAPTAPSVQFSPVKVCNPHPGVDNFL